jgi:hypothetical protein
VFSEGCSEIGWAKPVFDSSDLPDHISSREFCRKGYFVVPPEKPELRHPRHGPQNRWDYRAFIQAIRGGYIQRTMETDGGESGAQRWLRIPAEGVFRGRVK